MQLISAKTNGIYGLTIYKKPESTDEMASK